MYPYGQPPHPQQRARIPNVYPAEREVPAQFSDDDLAEALRHQQAWDKQNRAVKGWKRLVKRAQRVCYWRRLGGLLLNHVKQFSGLSWRDYARANAWRRGVSRAATRATRYLTVRRPHASQIPAFAQAPTTPTVPTAPSSSPPRVSLWGALDILDKATTVLEVVLFLLKWFIYYFGLTICKWHSYFAYFGAGYFAWGWYTAGEDTSLPKIEDLTPTESPGDPPELQ
jgi:hypothetical protein